MDGFIFPNNFGCNYLFKYYKKMGQILHQEYFGFISG